MFILMHEVLKIHFYHFSSECEIGSNLQFTQNCGYDSDNRKILYAKGSSSLSFLLAQVLLLVLAVLAGTSHQGAVLTIMPVDYSKDPIHGFRQVQRTGLLNLVHLNILTDHLMP